MSTAKAIQAARRQALKEHLECWFYRPDMLAVEAALVSVYAHFSLEADPLWLFVVGPARSGKTSVIINACAAAHGATILSKVTPRTFLSAYRGVKDASLLHRLGATPILLLKDFTSILSLREEDRSQIASDLREIYDGYISKPTGMGQQYHEWHGKATVIAVCTPAIDRAWAIQQELGERFLTVRWPRIGGAELAERARKQRGHEKAIAATTRELARALLAHPANAPPLTREQASVIDNLAEIVSLCRGHIHRSRASGVTEPPQPEEPTTTAKGLDVAARYHAALLAHDQVEPEDLAISHRIAADSIPPVRHAVLWPLLSGERSAAELVASASISRSSLDYIVEDLSLLGIVEVVHNPVGNTYKLTAKFAALARAANLTLTQQSPEKSVSAS